MDTKYLSPKLAILTDLRDPHITTSTHPEWRYQFTKTITSPKVHHIIEQKLAKFAPLILCYTKIIPDTTQLTTTCNYHNPTICIISSVGEHHITPWMIIHNIGHTYLSWHVPIKKDIIKLLGLDPIHYSIVANQTNLVHSAAARNGSIPNLNELIYELYTTWIWYGHTKSNNQELANYCDKKFDSIMANYRGKVCWHKYRSPITIN